MSFVPSVGVTEGLRTLLESLVPLEPVTVDLEEAEGLVLAEPIISHETHPADDTSAMDGYAVRCSDLASATPENPVILEQVEDVAAGFPPERPLTRGQTSRISTGALIPDEAEAVVIREVVEVVGPGRIQFTAPVELGANIRRAGEHLKPGDEVLRAGTILEEAELGMAAYLGVTELRCHPRLKVAILATGSELTGPGQPLGRGQVRDSNGTALACAVRKLGGRVVLRDRVGDSAEALFEALQRASESCQVILTSGGISAGWHDLVRESIESLGGKFAFHKLRMRPGKPIAFGHLGSSFFFCLPGNPVSSLVTFEVFVRPALMKLMGRQWKPLVRKARLLEPIDKREGFTVFFRGIAEADDNDAWSVRLTGPQGSHQLKSMVHANVLIRVPEEVVELEVGDEVEILVLKGFSG